MSCPSPRSTFWRDSEFWQDANNHTNESVLRETKFLQDQSLEALERIRCQATMTNEVGKETLSALHDQDARLESAQTKACKLSENLDRASKQQDRFARLAFRFGTKRKARKEFKREEKENQKAGQTKGTSPVQGNQAAVATFKRKGPRPPKKSSTVDQEIDQAEKRNDKENLSNARLQSKPGNANKETSRGASGSFAIRASKEKPLSDGDKRDLLDIEDIDALIDKGINALGAEFEELLTLSKSMSETVNRQNEKLETIDTSLETTKTKTKVLNKRLKLFTKKR